jgi:hypothetical protein
MELDRNGLVVLDRDACIAHLASVAVARIGLSVQALPVILPVNFVIDGDDIVIRTNAGTKTEAALRGSVVAVEADDYDAFAHTGWSVLVRGRSRLVEDPREIERLGGLWVRAWGTPQTDRWIAIAMEVVTGRSIVHVARTHRPEAASPRPETARAPGSGVAAALAFGAPAPLEEPFVAVAWEAWGAVRTDHHTTSADSRTTAADPHVGWPASAGPPRAVPEEDG